MKEIELTQGQVAIVDDDDYEYLSQWKWLASFDKHTGGFYAMRREYPSRKWVHMHRVIMETPDGLVVDHINHDTLYNVKENLKNSTYSENSWNRKKTSNGYTKKNNGYQAQITITENGKRKNIFLGVFRTQEEASIAYQSAAQHRAVTQVR